MNNLPVCPFTRAESRRVWATRNKGISMQFCPISGNDLYAVCLVASPGVPGVPGRCVESHSTPESARRALDVLNAHSVKCGHPEKFMLARFLADAERDAMPIETKEFNPFNL